MNGEQLAVRATLYEQAGYSVTAIARLLDAREIEVREALSSGPRRVAKEIRQEVTAELRGYAGAQTQTFRAAPRILYWDGSQPASIGGAQ